MLNNTTHHELIINVVVYIIFIFWVFGTPSFLLKEDGFNGHHLFIHLELSQR